ncbi:MAG: hypothetical protein KC766_31185 [Myxococcales bacterium]|nr:hypothetical protein [Myxococcales bacterium]
MSAVQDPPRMVEAEDVPMGLRALMEDSHKDVLSQAQVLAIASSVSRATAGASLAPVALKTGSGSVLKWIGGAFVVGLLGVGGFQLLRAPEPPGRVSTPVALPQPTSEVNVAPVEVTAPAASAEEVAPKPRAIAPSAAGKVASEPSPKAQLLEESRLLSAARAALASNPRKALALTERHRTKFPQGTLAQEREVIAIQALGKLGKQKDAEQRANKFGKDYPDSAHQERVQGSVGDKP